MVVFFYFTSFVTSSIIYCYLFTIWLCCLVLLYIYHISLPSGIVSLMLGIGGCWSCLALFGHFCRQLIGFHVDPHHYYMRSLHPFAGFLSDLPDSTSVNRYCGSRYSKMLCANPHQMSTTESSPQNCIEMSFLARCTCIILMFRSSWKRLAIN